MKILFVTHYSALYGANKSLLDLIDGLEKTVESFSCEVIIFGKGPMIEELKKRNIKTYRSLYTNDVYIENRKFEFVRVFIKTILNFLSFLILTIRILLGTKVDIIHTNSSITYLGILLAFLFRKKHVWHIREFAYESFKYKYWGGSKLFNLLLEKSYPIAISQSIYDRRLKDVSVDRKIVINDGVIPDNYIQQIGRRLSETGEIRFGIVGYISEVKNQKEALLAFLSFNKNYPFSKLFIAGEGDQSYIEDLKEIIRTNNLDNSVIFKGYISNIMEFYTKIDILLMCTRNEALGRVTIEAMANGVPVIGYDNAGTSEIVGNNHNGLLYKGDHSELGRRMEEISSKDLFSEMSRNASASVQKYTIEKSSQQVITFYESLLTSR